MVEYDRHSSREDATPPSLRTCIVGIGGAGSNVLDRITLDRTVDAQLICMHTDVRVLSHAMAPTKIQLGADLMRGVGAGGRREQRRGERQRTGRVGPRQHRRRGAEVGGHATRGRPLREPLHLRERLLARSGAAVGDTRAVLLGDDVRLVAGLAGYQNATAQDAYDVGGGIIAWLIQSGPRTTLNLDAAEPDRVPDLDFLKKLVVEELGSWGLTVEVW